MHRNRKYKVLAIFCVNLFAQAVLIQSAASAAEYHLQKTVTLGGEGGWDYFDVDPDTGRVFIPLGSHILVVDREGKQLADIQGVKDAHAIVFAPDLGKAFLSTDASVSVLDMKTLKVEREIPLPGKDPDAILYDPTVKRVFTFNGGGTEDATAVNALTGEVLGSIPVGGKPETAQADGAGHIYVNVEDKSRMAVFDAKSLKVVANWDLTPCKDPAGLAIDVAHKRLFAGCRNQLMAVVDYTTGKVTSTVPIGKGVDANRFDPVTGLAFASCGDGTITVAHEGSDGKFSVLQKITTQPGARTMTLDAKNHMLYTVTSKFKPPPPATAEHPHPYPSPVAGTFTLLIFAQ